MKIKDVNDWTICLGLDPNDSSSFSPLKKKTEMIIFYLIQSEVIKYDNIPKNKIPEVFFNINDVEFFFERRNGQPYMVCPVEYSDLILFINTKNK